MRRALVPSGEMRSVVIQRAATPRNDHIPDAAEQVGDVEEAEGKAEEPKARGVEVHLVGHHVKDLEELEDTQQLAQLEHAEQFVDLGDVFGRARAVLGVGEQACRAGWVIAVLDDPREREG